MFTGKNRGRESLGLVAFVLLCITTPCFGDMVIFADSEFAPGDWTLEYFFELGAGGTTTAQQQGSGGNPGAYRMITNTVFQAPPYAAVSGFHAYRLGTYDPASQGAILMIDYSEDAIMISGGGAGQAAGPALRQGDLIYLCHFSTPEPHWTKHLLVGLTSEDFYVRGYPDLHPDFSEQGAPIEFGFWRGNSTYSSGYTIVGGIDNWSMTLHTTGPTPTIAPTWGQIKALYAPR